MRRVRVPVLAVQTKEGHTVTLLYLARSEFQKYFQKAIIFEKRNNKYRMNIFRVSYLAVVVLVGRI